VIAKADAEVSVKAIVQRNYGPAEKVLSLQEIDKPAPKDDEVLVRVRAASMHPDVWHVVNGWPFVLRLLGAGVRRPKNPVPGMDVAGVVEAIGSKVSRFKPGDEVFGATVFMRWFNGGAFAEYTAVRESMLAHQPPNVTFEQAASVPTPGLIALVNLRAARIAQGHRVLINGAGGNVGTVALQIAKARGAQVTAVDVASKLEVLRSLGADHVVDYRTEDFTRGEARYDFILDVASNLSYSKCQRLLAPGGVYWLIGHDQFGTASGRFLGSIPRMIAFMIGGHFGKRFPKLDAKFPAVEELMETLRGHLESGELTPIIATTYRLDRAAAAMRHLQEGTALGRIVIIV
jgi:NADPH:quinone reductase-like Zn-dependent oxidoreductase